MLPSKTLIGLYTSDTGTVQYSIMYRSVKSKSSSLKDICPCLVFILYVEIIPLYKFGISTLILYSVPPQVIFPHLCVNSVTLLTLICQKYDSRSMYIIPL